MSDWTAYSPTITGFGTPSSVAFYSRRVGDSLEIRGTFVSGTPSAAAATFTLGYNGTNGNVTTSPNIPSSAEVCGTGFVNTTGLNIPSVVCAASSSVLYFSIQSVSAAGLNTGTTGSAILNSGEYMSVFAKVPISGWTGLSQAAYLPSSGGLAAGDAASGRHGRNGIDGRRRGCLHDRTLAR